MVGYPTRVYTTICLKAFGIVELPFQKKKRLSRNMIGRYVFKFLWRYKHIKNKTLTHGIMGLKIF